MPHSTLFTPEISIRLFKKGCFEQEADVTSSSLEFLALTLAVTQQNNKNTCLMSYLGGGSELNIIFLHWLRVSQKMGLLSVKYLFHSQSSLDHLSTSLFYQNAPLSKEKITLKHRK